MKSEINLVVRTVKYKTTPDTIDKPYPEFSDNHARMTYQHCQGFNLDSNVKTIKSLKGILEVHGVKVYLVREVLDVVTGKITRKDITEKDLENE